MGFHFLLLVHLPNPTMTTTMSLCMLVMLCSNNIEKKNDILGSQNVSLIHLLSPSLSPSLVDELINSFPRHSESSPSLCGFFSLCRLRFH